MAVVRRDGIEELAASRRVEGRVDKATLEAAERARKAQEDEQRKQLERIERETKRED